MSKVWRWIKARRRGIGLLAVCVAFVGFCVFVVHNQSVQNAGLQTQADEAIADRDVVAQQAKCLAAAYDAQAKQLNQVSKIGVEDRQVIDDLIFALPTLTSPEGFQAALDAYQQARHENEAKRADFPPYPQLADICPPGGTRKTDSPTPTPSATPSGG